MEYQVTKLSEKVTILWSQIQNTFTIIKFTIINYVKGYVKIMQSCKKVSWAPGHHCMKLLLKLEQVN